MANSHTHAGNWWVLLSAAFLATCICPVRTAPGFGAPRGRAVISWVNPVDGLFGDGTKWSSGTVPQPDDDINFFSVGAYTVTFDTDYETHAGKVRFGDVTFDLGGFAHTSNIAFSEWPLIGFTVGEVVGTSSVTFLNGTVNSQRVVVGSHPTVAPPAGAFSTLTFGAGSTLNANTTQLNSADGAELVFRDGAIANFTQGISSSEYWDQNTNILITGAGTTVNTSSIFSLNSGTGTLTVTDSATLNAGFSLYLGRAEGSRANVVVDNATVNVGRFSDDYTGAADVQATLTITNGGQLTATGGFSDWGQSGVDRLATATISGAGSKWMLHGSNYVGKNGHGIVNVSDGGEFMPYQGGGLGQLPGGLGEVNVEDPGSLLNLYAYAYGYIIGNEGQGVVTIATGATAEVYGQVHLAYAPDSFGHVQVDGVGSNWTDPFGNHYTNTIGRAGHGVFDVTGGAEALLTGDDAVIGDLDGSLGEVNVTGSGSSWDIGYAGSGTYGAITVGKGGEGSFNVSDGAVVRSSAVTIGDQATSVGSVLIDGAGSLWTLRFNDLIIGNLGQGQLTLDNGGSIEMLDGAATVGANGVLLGGGSAITGDVGNGGTVSPGNPIGDLTIEGNYTQLPSGQLSIEIGGDTPGLDHDQLIVEGNVNLEGVLDLSLEGGFEPSGGQSFIIVTIPGGAGTVSGQFDEVTGETSFNIAYHPDRVVITYAAPLDCNDNGIPDADEIAADPELDSDGTGILDECEDRGDLDGDGFVAIADLLTLLAEWGPCPGDPEPCPADLDGNGSVDILDLLTILANWD